MVFWFEQYSSKSRDAGTAQSHLTDDQKHPLHESHSIFAGMFTEAEVLNLRELSGVSAPSLMDRSIYDALQSQLDPKALKEHYSSYLAGGRISVYNPVSIMSAFENHQIRNFWTQTGLIVVVIIVLPHLINSIGEYPLLRTKISEGVFALNRIAALLCHKEVSFELQDSVIFSECAHFLSSQTIAYTHGMV